MAGTHRIGGAAWGADAPCHQARDPRTGQPVGDWFPDATDADITRALDLAVEAADAVAAVPSAERGRLVLRVAAQLERHGDRLVAQADLETGRGTSDLADELQACCAALRRLAAVLATGGDVGAVIATGPRPVRQVWRPIGPVLVVEADSMPFVHGVPGVDTTSALAAGCPVVVRASAHHPGTALACAAILDGVLREAAWHPGSFALLHGHDPTVTEDLVAADGLEGVAFTGAADTGQALADLAAARPAPAVFSGRHPAANPVVVTAAALRRRPTALAQDIVRAALAAGGQDPSRPAVVLVPADVSAEWFVDALSTRLRRTAPIAMRSAGAHSDFIAEVSRRLDAPGVTLLSDRVVDTSGGYTQHPVLLSVGADDVVADPALAEPCPGPALTVVRTDPSRVPAVVAAMRPSAVAAVHAAGDARATVVAALGARADRVLLREVDMQEPDGSEGTPQRPGRPRVTRGRDTVDPGDGADATSALRRWQRRVTYDGVADDLLPPALQNANPLGIVREIDGQRTGDPVGARLGHGPPVPPTE